MSIKLAAYTVVLNDEDYIYHALAGLRKVVDYHVVIEGAAFHGMPEATAKGLSTDNTQGQIERFLNETDRGELIYKQIGKVQWLSELRAEALRSIPDDADYCLLVDADHLYDWKEIAQIKAVLEQWPNIKLVRGQLVFFYRDFQHILDIDPAIRPGWDAYHFLFRMKEGREEQINLSIAADCPQLRELWKLPEVAEKELKNHASESVALSSPSFHFFHTGWVRRGGRMEVHLLQRFRECIESARLTGVWKASEPFERMSHLTDEEIIEWCHLYHKIWSNNYDRSCGEHVAVYEGDYPEILKEHPFFGQNKEDLGLYDLGKSLNYWRSVCFDQGGK